MLMKAAVHHYRRLLSTADSKAVLPLTFGVQHCRFKAIITLWEKNLRKQQMFYVYSKQLIASMAMLPQ